MAELPALPHDGVDYIGGAFYKGEPSGRPVFCAFKILGATDRWVAGLFDEPAGGGSPLETVRHHFQGLNPLPQITGEYILRGAYQVVGKKVVKV
ncbi:MAG: hypothetical protein ACT6RU_14420 [Aliihoeflea sp.]|uniref:hypothetical protein n=1 Tax=Aliihoeflea sp. TaxID=2608088 RepID=UPI004034F06A